jgi:hypothetical protein
MSARAGMPEARKVAAEHVAWMRRGGVGLEAGLTQAAQCMALHGVLLPQAQYRRTWGDAEAMLARAWTAAVRQLEHRQVTS